MKKLFDRRTINSIVTKIDEMNYKPECCQSIIQPFKFQQLLHFSQQSEMFADQLLKYQIWKPQNDLWKDPNDT